MQSSTFKMVCSVALLTVAFKKNREMSGEEHPICSLHCMYRADENIRTAYYTIEFKTAMSWNRFYLVSNSSCRIADNLCRTFETLVGAIACVHKTNLTKATTEAFTRPA